MNIKNKNTAFTLAEVLITLMIIGILAMVTIPGLLQAWEERATVTQLRKTYSILSEAYINILRDYGSDFYKEAAPGPVWKNYLAVAKDCGFTGTGCFAASYRNLKQNTNGELMANVNGVPLAKMLLKDGSAVAFVQINYYGYIKYEDNTAFTPLIYVDINGVKPPNSTGRDTFLFIVGKNRIIPFDWVQPSGIMPKSSYSFFKKILCEKNDNGNLNGMTCTRWVIERGNMDYLKNDVDW